MKDKKCSCGIDLLDHAKCASCGILIGPSHEPGTTHKRHLICDGCAQRWQLLEAKSHRILSLNAIVKYCEV